MTLADQPLAVQVDAWRQKAIAGTITMEELREAIKTLRGIRVSAASAPAAKKASAAKAAAGMADDILGELDI